MRSLVPAMRLLEFAERYPEIDPDLVGVIRGMWAAGSSIGVIRRFLGVEDPGRFAYILADCGCQHLLPGEVERAAAGVEVFRG